MIFAVSGAGCDAVYQFPTIQNVWLLWPRRHYQLFVHLCWMCCRFHWVQWQQWMRQSNGWVTRICMWECAVILSCMESITLHCRWLVDFCRLPWI